MFTNRNYNRHTHFLIFLLHFIHFFEYFLHFCSYHNEILFSTSKVREMWPFSVSQKTYGVRYRIILWYHRSNSKWKWMIVAQCPVHKSTLTVGISRLDVCKMVFDNLSEKGYHFYIWASILMPLSPYPFKVSSKKFIILSHLWQMWLWKRVPSLLWSTVEPTVSSAWDMKGYVNLLLPPKFPSNLKRVRYPFLARWSH